jgi:hypothetical protein
MLNRCESVNAQGTALWDTTPLSVTAMLGLAFMAANIFCLHNDWYWRISSLPE